MVDSVRYHRKRRYVAILSIGIVATVCFRHTNASVAPATASAPVTVSSPVAQTSVRAPRSPSADVDEAIFMERRLPTPRGLRDRSLAENEEVQVMSTHPRADTNPDVSDGQAPPPPLDRSLVRSLASHRSTMALIDSTDASGTGHEDHGSREDGNHASTGSNGSTGIIIITVPPMTEPPVTTVYIPPIHPMASAVDDLPLPRPSQESAGDLSNHPSVDGINAVRPASFSPDASPQPLTHSYQGGGTSHVGDDSSGTTKWVAIGPSQVPKLVAPGDEGTATPSTKASTDSTKVYPALDYPVTIMALVSFVWLLVSSVLRPVLETCSFNDGMSHQREANQWEFGLFACFVHGIASISHLAMTPKVPTFLLAFADVFSWTLFIPIHTTNIDSSRRLDQLVLDGLIAFSSRIGVREVDFLYRTVQGFITALMAITVIVVIVARICLRRRRHSFNDMVVSGYTDSPMPSALVRRIVGGIMVCLWLFAVYPLALTSSFKISMESRSSEFQLTGMTAAIIVLTVICLGGLVVAVLSIQRLSSETAMMARGNVIVWGVLYNDVRIEKRLFFVVFVVVQLVRGVVIGSVLNGTVQIALVFTMDAIVLIAILTVRPFQPDTVVRWFALAVFTLRITSSALFTFSTISSSSFIRHFVATVLLVLSVIVVLLWFVRHVKQMWSFVQPSLGPRNSDSDDSAHLDPEIYTPSPSSETDASHYNGPYARFTLNRDSQHQRPHKEKSYNEYT